jgi:hypothetical protein
MAKQQNQPKLKNQKQEKERKNEKFDIGKVGMTIRPLLLLAIKIESKKNNPNLDGARTNLRLVEERINMNPEDVTPLSSELLTVLKGATVSEESYKGVDSRELEALINNVILEEENKNLDIKKPKSKKDLDLALAAFRSLRPIKDLNSEIIPTSSFEAAYQSTVDVLNDLYSSKPSYDYTSRINASIFSYNLTGLCNQEHLSAIRTKFEAVLDMDYDDHNGIKLLAKEVQAVHNEVAKKLLKISDIQKNTEAQNKKQEEELAKEIADKESRLKLPAIPPKPMLQARYYGALRVPGPTTLSQFAQISTLQPKWQQGVRNFVKNKIPEFLKFSKAKEFLPTLKSKAELDINTNSTFQKINLYRIRMADMVADYKFLIEGRLGRQLLKEEEASILKGKGPELIANLLAGIDEKRQDANLQAAMKSLNAPANEARNNYMYNLPVIEAVKTWTVLQREVELINISAAFNEVLGQKKFEPLQFKDSKFLNITGKVELRSIEMFMNGLNSGMPFVDYQFGHPKTELSPGGSLAIESEQDDNVEPAQTPNDTSIIEGSITQSTLTPPDGASAGHEPPTLPDTTTSIPTSPPIPTVDYDESIIIQPEPYTQSSNQVPLSKFGVNQYSYPEANKNTEVKSETEFVNKYFQSKSFTIDSLSTAMALGNMPPRYLSISGLDENGKESRLDLSDSKQSTIEKSILIKIQNHLSQNLKQNTPTVLIKNGKLEFLNNSNIKLIPSPVASENILNSEVTQEPGVGISDSEIEEPIDETLEITNPNFFLNSESYKQNKNLIFTDFFANPKYKNFRIKSITNYPSSNETMVRFVNEDNKDIDVRFQDKEVITTLTKYEKIRQKSDLMIGNTTDAIASNAFEFLLQKNINEINLSILNQDLTRMLNTLNSENKLDPRLSHTIEFTSFEPLSIKLYDERNNNIDSTRISELSALLSSKPELLDLLNQFKKLKSKIKFIAIQNTDNFEFYVTTNSKNIDYSILKF